MNLTSENDLRAAIKKHIGPHAHLSMLEAHGNPGFPDIEYCIEGATGHIELKWTPKDYNQPVALRAAQKVWFRRRIAAGGRPMIWLGDPDAGLFIIPAWRIAPFLEGEHKFPAWAAASEADFGWNRMDLWDRLMRIMKHADVPQLAGL